jgi:multiple sugar transport system substrate-binding protein
MSTRRSLGRWVRVLPTCLLILGAACNRRAPAGAAPGGRSAARVSFMVFGDPAELRAYQRLVDRFESDQSEVDVELIHVPGQSDYRRRLGTDFAAGAPADVFLINYRRYAAFAQRGVLEPLGPYLQRSSVIRESELFPEALAPFRWRGTLMGIPQNVSSLVVFYNRDLFDAAKVPYPKPDWTWRDFVATALKLTRDTSGDGRPDQYGLGTEVSFQRLAPFIWQNGGSLVDDEEKPTRLLLDTPAALEALQWFVDLRARFRVVPGDAEERAEDSESRFQNGRTAMFLNSRRGVPTYREIKGFQWDVAPLPRGRKAAGILHADAYFMPKSARNKEAAWEFIEYANSAKGQEIVAAAGRTVPSRKDVAASTAFLDPTSPPRNSRVFLDTLPVMRAVPVHPNWADVEEIASEELERAFYGGRMVVGAADRIMYRTAEFFTTP